ncbi:MAG: hypothetical protein ABIG89_06055 [Candidatus Woesearchaeota archaeon]
MAIETAKQYFFRYAWPCTEVILADKRITQQRFDNLKSAIENNITPSREILEDTYKVAIDNLKELAERINAERNKGNNHNSNINDKNQNNQIDYWDVEVIKAYFTEKVHNEFIESEKAFFSKFPPSIKDLCRIHKAVIEKIENINGKRIVFVRYNVKSNVKSKERRCINLYNLELKQGDEVIIHYAYVIEKA